MTDRQLLGAVIRASGLYSLFQAVGNLGVGLAQLVVANMPHKYPAGADFVMGGIELALFVTLLRWGDCFVRFAY